VAQVPLPNDVTVTMPAADVPAKISAFAGAWGGGAWGGTLPNMLVVEKVNPDGTAAVVYAWGNDGTGHIRAGWVRNRATITGCKLHIANTSGPMIDYELNSNGRLTGSYRYGGPPSRVELVRFPSAGREELQAFARKAVPPPWEEIRIPEGSRLSKTLDVSPILNLQATLYRSARPGRQPVVIFNHGSTGLGETPASTIDRGWSETSVFRALGFTVVVPMRKGRGLSDGPFTEEAASVSQEVQLSSAVEDLDATVEYLRSQPYVDPSRIVVAGQSRGGILSVVYAGRNPEKIVGVVNFAGGWWGERMPTAEFNITEFREAGHTSRVPMLWLYADNDSYYSLPYIEKAFAEFTSAGGKGRLFVEQHLEGNGHFLIAWPDKWRDAVSSYLGRVVKPDISGDN
jgi:dienelactone hydrolase